LEAGQFFGEERSMPATRVVHAGRNTVEVHVFGEGPVVVMIPSLGRRADDFTDLAVTLAAAGYTAAPVEPRGVGNSVGPMENLTLHDLAADTAAVIEEIGRGGPAVVVGHAFGQRVCRTLASDRPDLVSAVIMIAAGGKVPPSEEAVAALRACFDLSLPQETRMEFVRSAFFAAGNEPAAWRDGWEPGVAQMQIRASEATPVDSWWGAGQAPLLVIQGLQDRMAVPENGRLLQKEMGSRVELVEIEGAGHALLPERPEEIATAVLRYLKRLSGETASGSATISV
jgi:pimeloyl-ACP methyl ester carboxylesterase